MVETLQQEKDKKMSFTKFKSCIKKHTFEQIMQGTREYLKLLQTNNIKSTQNVLNQ